MKVPSHSLQVSLDMQRPLRLKLMPKASVFLIRIQFKTVGTDPSFKFNANRHGIYLYTVGGRYRYGTS